MMKLIQHEDRYVVLSEGGYLCKIIDSALYFVLLSSSFRFHCCWKGWTSYACPNLKYLAVQSIRRLATVVYTFNAKFQLLSLV